MKSWQKYWAFARIAAVEAATRRGDLYGRAAFFAVILAVFSALWRAVAEAGMPLVGGAQQLVWYLAATEWILLSTPQRQLDIQEEVRRGDVACQLSRPVGYSRAALAQCFGTLLVRAPVLGGVALLCGFAFTGELPPWPRLLCLLPAGFAASFVLSELYVALGLISFWITDATPLYWVASKALFVLGGLMLPLELYPRWLQLVGRCTPFPSILAGPGGFMLHTLPSGVVELAARLLLWAALLFGLVELLSWRALRGLQVNGG